MHRRPAKAVAGHFRGTAHRHIHFTLLFHLFHIVVGDPVARRAIADDEKLPGLAVAAGGRLARAVENISNCLVGNSALFIVTADAAPLFDQ